MALVITGHRFMQLVPQQLYLVYPGRVNRLEDKDELGIVCQPALNQPTLVDHVVIQDQRDVPGSSVASPQRFQQRNE